ncbi:MAG: methyltransferase domain-containing protein [Terriglobia bacterium]
MMTLEDCRRFYADEVRLAANIGSPALIEAFARVPREKYLGPPPWQIGSAEQRALSLVGMGSLNYTPTENPQDVYHNVVIALDAARDINNGQPGALARWIDALDLKAGDRVYHLGCGVGYYTAIMAEVVGTGGVVVGSEVHTELAARAKENLSGYANVTVHVGDGAAFDPGVCDAMFINAGVTHPHRPWLERLREGGRLVLPVTMAINPTVGQGLMVKITRERGAFSAQIVSVVAIFSCTSVRDPQLEPVIAKAFAGRALFKLKSVRLDAHEPTGTCILHGSDVCVSGAEPEAISPAPTG